MNKKIFNNLYIMSFFSLLVMLILADNSYATAATTEYTQIESTLCKVLEMLTGTIGKAIAAFAIIFIGVSLFMGKVSWGLAISTALGIGAIFGAAGLVTSLGGGTLDIDDCASANDAATV
jgi:type IV secretory pathway VirB2 component (pilin)